ncbi:hypothetical protein J6590_048688 [Homalodisca vitripennis]|nr:hypothetical protein J6590_048688 [Homalodisca vitripennis]
MAKKKEPPAKKSKKPGSSDSTSEDEDAFSIQDSGESDLVLSDTSEDEMFEPLPDPQPQLLSSVSGSSSIDPGMVSTIDQTGAFVDCMEPIKKNWKWPAGAFGDRNVLLIDRRKNQHVSYGKYLNENGCEKSGRRISRVEEYI